MKKLLSLVLSSAMIISLLAGCGATPETTETTEPTAEGTTAVVETETEAVATGDQTEITVWRTSQENDTHRSLDEAFLAANPDLALNIVIKEGDPQHEFYQAVATGNAPHVLKAEFTNLMKLAANDVIEPLTDMVAEWDQWPNYTQAYVDMLSKNGEVYGVPYIVIPMLFGYNKAIFEEKDLEVPTTWDDAIEVGKQISDPDNQVIGYATLAAEWTEWFFQYYVWQAGGNLTTQNDDGTINLTFTDPAVIEAAEYYQTMKSEGVLQSDLTLKFDDLIKLFAQGKVGMMPIGGDWISRFIAEGMDYDDIGVSVSPAGPGGNSNSAIGGASFGIQKGLDDTLKEAAFRYISFYSGAEGLSIYFEDLASKGATDLVIIARDDMSVGDFYELDPSYIEILETSKTAGRLEFAGKPAFGIYVDRVVQKLFVEPDMDIEAEFQAAQDLATSEALEKYNTDNKVAE